jgi:hypothetical protein
MAHPIFIKCITTVNTPISINLSNISKVVSSNQPRQCYIYTLDGKDIAIKASYSDFMKFIQNYYTVLEFDEK